MNDRIKEIAKQTGIWFVTDREDLLNDFVESIIRECADIALREDHDPSDCILNHFGLKR